MNKFAALLFTAFPFTNQSAAAEQTPRNGLWGLWRPGPTLCQIKRAAN